MMSRPRGLPRPLSAADTMAAGPAGDGLYLAFRAGGGAERYCTEGWSAPEETETWSLGRRSVLVLPVPARAPGSTPEPAAGAAAPHLLVLHLRPHVVEGMLPVQRLRVLANGVAVGSFTLARRGARACIIPAAALTGRASLEIVLEMPDAARPSDLAGGRDTRMLAVALTALRLYPDRLACAHPASDHPACDPPRTAVADDATMTPPQLMLRFESLGQNCEFGLVQRRAGAEPLGLLRFASTPLPILLDALDARFAGLGESQSVRVAMSSNGREFMVEDTSYGLTYHAWVNAGEMTAEALRQREVRRVPVLVRKLLEELDLGDKIFVFKGMGALAEEVVFPLAAVLRRYAANRLLYVTLADAAHPAGTVEARPAGYLVGYLDRFAPGEDAHDFLFDQWIAICRAALRLDAAADRA